MDGLKVESTNNRHRKGHNLINQLIIWNKKNVVTSPSVSQNYLSHPPTDSTVIITFRILSDIYSHTMILMVLTFEYRNRQNDNEETS